MNREVLQTLLALLDHSCITFLHHKLENTIFAILTLLIPSIAHSVLYFSSCFPTCKSINHGAFYRELNSLQDDIAKFLGKNHQQVFSKKHSKNLLF